MKAQSPAFRSHSMICLTSKTTDLRSIAARTLACACLWGLLCAPPLRAQEASYKTNPKFKSAIADAQEASRKLLYTFAIEDYKKANKIADGKDPDCLKQIWKLQMKTGAYKDAAATASVQVSLATNPEEKAVAETSRGQALYLQAGDKGKADILQAADASLKAAIADDPKNGTAHYVDGHVLAKLGQNDAASEQFKQCLSCISPRDPSYLRAQHFAANPALATAKMAPAFTVVALDGSKFNLDQMDGRVVLIDFWATWCGPCNEELPHMKKIAKEFAGRPLVIISISWDSDESKWRSFIDKNEMTWVQYRDVSHHLSDLFDVHAIPHYFTIDSDGVLTSEMLGSGSDVEGKLKKLVAKAEASRKEAPMAAGN